MKKIKINRYIKLFLKLAITGIALYFVFNKIKLIDVIQIFESSNLFFLFLALICFVLSKLIASYRLNHFFRSINIQIPSSYNIKLYLLGMFYNLFLPGGIGGDGYKIYLLNKRFKVKVKRLFWALFLDRLVGILILFCLMVLLSNFLPYPIQYKYFTWILIPLSIVVFYLVIRKLFSHFTSIIFLTIFQSVFVQLLQLTSAILILFAFGIYENTTAYLFVFLISSIVAALPITIGGLGARELTFLYGAGLMHLDMNNSVGLSLMFYIITAMVSLSGIYYSFRSDKLY
ncbi:MAG: flippase-like domain-containing protein [Bacteroidetes bacterium]|nr:flippase-like domain-containing protein [Bacteroidota bacterium]